MTPRVTHEGEHPGGLTVGSLFSGIEGLGLGLERAGMELRWHAEVDPYCSAVHEKHWPGLPNLGDVTKVDWSNVERVNVICGGFPCQDISRVGRRGGIDGAKSGLWGEFARAVRVVRPDYVLVENSSSLTVHGLDRITGDLAACGYDAEWDCLPAAAFGAPHIRDRLYLLAYPRGRRHGSPHETVFAGWTSTQLHGGWSREPDVDRVDAGIPCGVDRRRVLGNAVVPAVAEHIGRQLLESLVSPAP